MRAQTCYWLVLLIYAALWACQIFVCNSTHSLIVLTDSYINLYYIIEIVLELVYLRVQSKIGEPSKEGSPAYRLLGRKCTYQFKRLPLLGSFMNNVFLSALLMSAAIEGIQSCFHVHHLIDEGGKPIILQHRLTYPGLLLGFACAGILMRAVLNSVHKMRDEENAGKELSSEKRSKPAAGTQRKTSSLDLTAGSQADISPNQNGQDATGIVLKSFRLNPNQDDALGSVYIPVGNSYPNHRRSTSDASAESHRTIKHTISPVALVACAIVVYFVGDDLVTEISDAVLAIVVVVVVYVASYASFDYSGKTLLQSAPVDLNLNCLKADLVSISPLVSSVDELHVWSLTNESGRIGSCKLLISKDNLSNDQEVADVLKAARSKFLANGIRCCCVQPILLGPTEESAAKEEAATRCHEPHGHQHEHGHEH